MIASLVGIWVLTSLVTLVVIGSSSTDEGDMATPSPWAVAFALTWPVWVVVSAIALPVAILALIAELVLGCVKRRMRRTR